MCKLVSVYRIPMLLSSFRSNRCYRGLPETEKSQPLPVLQQAGEVPLHCPKLDTKIFKFKM